MAFVGARGVVLALAGLALVVRGDEPVVLPPWVVAAQMERPWPAARLDRFAATLGPTSAVDAGAWGGREAATLAEALRGAPGVQLQESFGGFEPPRLSIRGSGLDSAPTSRGVALLVDGLPLARADGVFHAGLFDPRLFSRVEVYRGTMHMALTPAALGGVLHAVSRDGERESGAGARFEAGDWGSARTHVWGVGSGFAVAGGCERGGGWRERSAQWRGTLAGSWTRAVSPTARIGVSLMAAATEYEVPGPLTQADAAARPRSVSAAVTRDLPRRESSVLRPALEIKAALPDGGFSAGVAWQRLRDDFTQLQANGETDATSDDVSAQATFSRSLPTWGGREHRLLARAVFSGGENEVERYLNDRGRRGARFGAFAARAETGALSVEDLAWLTPDFAVGAGATALRARREIRERGASAGIARTLTFRDVSPRGGVTWRTGEAATWQIGVSRGIEPPTFDDLVSVAGTFPALRLQSRALRAQRATTWEVGGAGRWRELRWSVTVYRGSWSDEILRLADANGLPRGAVNAGRTVHEGVESALRWTPAGAPGWGMRLTSTLGRFRFDGDPVYGDNRLAGIPPHTGGVEIFHGRGRGVFGGVEVTWVAGRTPVDHAGRLVYGGGGLAHARVGWRRDAGLAVFAGASNLLDRNLVASTAGVLDVARVPATTAIFLPGTGRRLTLGVEWKR